MEAFLYVYILINLAALAFVLMRVEKMNEIIDNPHGQRVWGTFEGELFSGYIEMMFSDGEYLIMTPDKAVILQTWQFNPNIF
jgi:hypothetical protein